MKRGAGAWGRAVGGAFAGLVLLASVGCQSPTVAALADQPVVQAAGALAPGDIVKLSFVGAPELNQSQKIRVDGKISLPLVGEFTAAGKKLGPFQLELARLYHSQLQNKEVVVTLETSAIPIYVSGAVNHPGKVSLERPMTVLEGIMEAGGFSPRANPRRVVLIRTAAQRHTTQILNLNPVLRGDAAKVLYLRPYDVIYVQESLF